MNDHSVRHILLDALHKVAGKPDPERANRLRQPNNDMPIADLGLDSLEGIEWCMEIETLTGVELDPAELITVGSFDSLVKLVVDRQR